MKLPMLFFGLMVAVAPAFADDQQIAERKTCDQIKSEIAALTAAGTLTDEQSAELSQLKLQQRANCTTRGGGRRTTARVSVSANSNSKVKVEINPDALQEYLNAKKENCENLNAAMTKLAAANGGLDTLATMQVIYNTDCVQPDSSDILSALNNWASEQDEASLLDFDIDNTNFDLSVLYGSSAQSGGSNSFIKKWYEQYKKSHPESTKKASTNTKKTDEEIAAEYDANLAAGLCGDGTKPNRFGCCTGETFKDLGNLVFACCPNDGGNCYPPIK